MYYIRIIETRENEPFHVFGENMLVDVALKIEDGIGYAKVPPAHRGMSFMDEKIAFRLFIFPLFYSL
jgi:hypothetical protein